MQLLMFCFGLVWGSFFNVVIYRLPRGLSLVKPGSQCPKCGQALGWGELIPLASFLWQKGRCKACQAPISWRYPLVELASGVGFAFWGWFSSSWSELLAGLVFLSFLVVLAFIDLEHKQLPNVLTVPGIVLGLVFAFWGWTVPFWQAVLGAGVGFFIIFLLVVISRGGMGMGDAKLLAMIGAFLGWQKVFFVLFWGSLLGSGGGLLYLYFTKQDRKTPLPFGPSLIIAALILYFWRL